jgi:RNA polymerase sigma-70 factor, ECF subfamily
MLASRLASMTPPPEEPARELPPLDFVRAAKRGDSRAWRALFVHYQPALTAYCLACAQGRRDLALDLTQDVFASAIEKIGQLADEERFTGWLFTIARHRCLRQARLSARETAAVDMMSLLMTEGGPDPRWSHDREAWLEAVGRAVQGVANPSHRDIVSAHYGRGEKTRDIALRLSVPHGTVTVVLMRFRERLKARLMDLLAKGELS